MKEQQISQALDKLRFFVNKQNPIDIITPFYHTAELLQKFGKEQLQSKRKQPYFIQFYQLFQNFALRDFSSLKKHHQQILDQIVEIVQSQSFINCLRPDIKQLRNLRSSLRRTKSNIINLDIQQYDLITGQVTVTDNFSTFSNSGSKEQKSISNQQLSQIKYFQNEIKQTISHHQQFNIKQLNQLYQSIKKSYNDHCLDDAFKKMNEYLSKINNKNHISKQKDQFFKNVSEQYETMNNFYSEFQKGTWLFDKEQNGITLQYKIYQSQNMIAIRIQGEGQIPIEPFLAIISQIDLMGNYVPFCYGCKQMKKISRNQRIGSTKIYIPVLNDRQTFFYAAGYDRTKSHKSLFFFSKTINDDLHYQKKYNFNVPKEDKYVRLQYKFFIVQYIPLDLKRAKIRLASKIDMKMNYLPNFLLFKSCRMFAFDYFKNILNCIKKFKGSEWQIKLQQNPEMYKFFHQKIDQYIK